MGMKVNNDTVTDIKDSFGTGVKISGKNARIDFGKTREKFLKTSDIIASAKSKLNAEIDALIVKMKTDQKIEERVNAVWGIWTAISNNFDEGLADKAIFEFVSIFNEKTNEEVCTAIAQALGEMGIFAGEKILAEKILPPLKNKSLEINESRPAVRAYCVDALGNIINSRIETGRAVASKELNEINTLLAEVLDKDGEMFVRLTAASVFGTSCVKNETAIPALIKALGDKKNKDGPPFMVLREAVASLGNKGKAAQRASCALNELLTVERNKKEARDDELIILTESALEKINKK